MATRNSGRSDDRSNRSATSANPGATSGRRDNASSASSGGSRQNSGGMSDASRRASGPGASATESQRRPASSGGASGLGASTSGTSTSSAGANAANTTAESRSGTSQGGTGGASPSRGDQERQLRTAREEGRSRSSAQGNASHPQQQQQQGAPYASPGYFTGMSPFAMMRRMMDDMDRLFSDFGFAQPGLLSSSFFSPDLWSSPDSSRALGSGQRADQQRAISGQSSNRQGLQRSGSQSSVEPWSQGIWAPQVEVREQGNNLVVRADLPGLSRDDIDVEVDDDALIIRGERNSDWEDNQEGYYRSERSYGSFYRAIPLPEGVDPNSCNATFKDGVLEVTLPKPKESESRGKKIAVK